MSVLPQKLKKRCFVTFVVHFSYEVKTVYFMLSLEKNAAYFFICL